MFTLQAEVTDLQAAGEVTGAAVQGLEATLAAIERAESRRASQSATGTGSTSRRSRTPPGRSAAASRSSSFGGSRPQAAAGSGSTSNGRPSDDSSAARQLSRGSSSGGYEAAEAGWAADGEAAAGFSSGSDGGGSGSVALLSRELVKAQMGNADLQRKLRGSARCAATAVRPAFFFVPVLDGYALARRCHLVVWMS